MNSSYEKLRSQVIGLLRHVEPKDEETMSHALMAMIIDICADNTKLEEVHKAGEPQPRIVGRVEANRAFGLEYNKAKDEHRQR